MNNDFVRRSDILELKRTLYRVRYGTGCQSIEDTEAVEVDDIESVPTVDVQPIAEGEWLWEFADNGWANHICSRCGWTLNTDIHVRMDYRFCPNCGAKMKGRY